MTDASVFDKNIERWQKEMDLPWARLKYRLVQANLAKYIGSTPLKILDAGGGNGLDSIPLAVQGHQVEIVDYSGEMLADAIERAAREQAAERVAVHQADLQAIPQLFPEANFDLVLCHNVLQYVQDVPELIRNLAGCLKTGGLISIVSINRHSLPYRAAFMQDDLDEALTLLDARGVKAVIFQAVMTNYSVDEISQMLVEAGCAIEQDYGIRCMCDYWGDNERKSDPHIFEQIERLEFALTDRHPYKLLARYFQIIGRKG